jgi:branched-chain amino acid transport system ATP-binding protein
MPKEVLLRLQNASVRYGGIRALDDVSVELDEGEIVALMGPNGAGKSTALKAAFGIAPLASGKVKWHEAEIKPLPHEMVRRGLSFVPQGRRVFPHLSVEENLEVGGFTVGDRKEIHRRIDEVIDIFPALRPKRKTKSGALSGGEQQMLALARGLITDPKVLFLDEPSLGLAPKIVKEVFAKIKEINERRNTAIMVVEHNIKSLLEIADRAYVLDKGKIAYAGGAKELEHNRVLERVLLGN